MPNVFFFCCKDFGNHQGKKYYSKRETSHNIKITRDLIVKTIFNSMVPESTVETVKVVYLFVEELPSGPLSQLAFPFSNVKC